ncbi:Transcription factor LHW [Sesamum angolense]|uniref:Transcription factor LHW n=1 Tax=Sesamum angolense TaxID=2727404 RepID=A0AAE1WVM5_9LAMI|nr:Transcription factor LHW [Sesamum angolense]
MFLEEGKIAPFKHNFEWILIQGNWPSCIYKKPHWMYSDAYQERQNSLGTFESLEVLQDDSEFYCQFSVGIKTIALISVEPWGVVQLGSTQKIPETQDFVDQVKELFREMDKHQETKFSESEPPSESQCCDPSMQFNSLLSCGVSQSVNQSMKCGVEDEGFMEANHSLVLPSQSFHSDCQSRNSLFTASGLTENPIQVGSKPTSQLDQLLLESGNFFDFSATQALSNHSDCSVLTSCWPDSTSALNENVSPPKPRTYVSCRNSSSNAPVNPAFTSLQAPQFCNDTQSFSSLLDPIECKNKRPSSGLLTLEELIQENYFAETMSKSGLMDDLSQSQWFSSQPGSSGTPLTTLLCSDLSHVTGLIPASGLSGNNSAIHISDNLPANSIQSSVTDAFTSNHEVKASNMFGIDKPFNSLGVESGCKKSVGWSGNDLSFCTDVSSCISEKFHGQSAKRRKIDNYSWSHDDVKTQCIPSFDGQMKLMDPVYGPATSDTELNTEASKKIPGACISDNRTTSAGNTISSKGQDEPSKTGKKKAKPGTRPRPKDRQMIQDRLAELRELIPNGEKMSIDRLLERTIRHLNFMQSLTKHAESLKQIDKLKSGEARKKHASDDGGGATWAVEDQTMLCPLMVEDLRTPGQMLIEILCEEQGFFLEIIDVIRGFGLTILKGVMEVRETNVWANFIVESDKGTRPVTRHEIFSSLIQLLQMTGQDATNASDGIANTIGTAMPLFNNCQQAVSFPANLADTLQCANL